MDAFHKLRYRNFLLFEHLKEPFKFVKKVIYHDTGEEVNINEPVHVFLRDDQQWLVKVETNKQGIPLYTLDELLPLKIVDGKSRGVSWDKDYCILVSAFNPVQFRREQKHTFREFVDALTAFEHTNPEHQRLMMIIALAQRMSRCYFRVATNAGFGKDSTVGTIKQLFSGTVVTSKPTQAKLHTMLNYDYAVLNEAGNMPKDRWDLLTTILLGASDFQTNLDKESLQMGTGAVVNYDLSSFSMALFYNDFDHYSKTDRKNYFDLRAQRALRERMVPLRFYGSLSEDFSVAGSMDPLEVAEDNFDGYMDLLHSFHYWSDNWRSQVSGYATDFSRWSFNGSALSDRWVRNLTTLSMFIDLYAESEEEYHALMRSIEDAMMDYEEMMRYETVLALAEDRYDEVRLKEILEGAKKLKTFKEKHTLLKGGIQDTGITW
jgi:hypothetical protein